jgi:hypothetical protein
MIPMPFHIHHFNQLIFHEMLKCLVPHVFGSAISFHSSDVNQIQDYTELTPNHFHIHHFNQLFVHEVLKVWFIMFSGTSIPSINDI